MTWKFRLSLFLLFVLFLFSFCTFNDKNNTVQPSDMGTPTNPTPSEGAVNVDNVVTLKWSVTGADSFTILFDTQNPPKKIIKKNLTQTSYTTFAAGTATTYFWQVIAKFSNGISTSSAVWKFTTKANSSTDAGFIIKNFGIKTFEPNIIRALLQVTDLSNSGVTNLTANDFEVYEDGKKVSTFESLLNVSKKENNFFKFNTVLLIDNSTSITDDGGKNLLEIKNAAKNFVSNMFPQQYVTIYEFSSSTNLILDMTPVSNQAKIFSAIDGITKGARSTDLYGAVITGAEKINSSTSADSIISGALVLFTDGDDTQGSHTIQQALNAITNKNSYTIGLGTDLTPEVLSAIGKNGYFQISEINQLSQTFLTIQTYLEKLSNSFYWLEYQTPKRGNFNHLLQVVIINNPVNSILEASFNSSKFYDPIPGVYFTDSNGDKFSGGEIPLVAGGSYIDVYLSTYGGSSNPNYRWTSDSLLIFTSLNPINSQVRIAAKSNAANQSKAYLKVEDINNNLSGQLNFIISKTIRKKNGSR